MKKTAGRAMTAAFVLATVTLVAIVSLRCNNGSGNGPSPVAAFEPPQGEYISESYSWLAGSGQTMHLFSHVCDSGQGGWKTKASFRSIAYTVDASTLSLRMERIGGLGETDSAYADINLMFSREKGEGLFGLWSLADAGFTSEQPLLSNDSLVAAAALNKYTALGFDFLGIYQDSFVIYDTMDSTQCPTCDFVERWNNSYDGIVSVAVEKVDKYILRMIGGVSGDTVVISVADNGNITTRGSGSEHATHTFVAHGGGCPNPQFPNWFTNEFVLQNAVGVIAAPQVSNQ